MPKGIDLTKKDVQNIEYLLKSGIPEEAIAEIMELSKKTVERVRDKKQALQLKQQNKEKKIIYPEQLKFKYEDSKSVNMRIGYLKSILNKLPDDMLVVIPVIDEDNSNHIYGFRKVRTVGILVCEGETDREALCLNTAAYEKDIADQVYFSGIDVKVKEILFGGR